MTPITRLHYRERQRLRTADLADEQLYLVQARRRHNITHHTWGIVWGLALTEMTQMIDSKKETVYFVQPGVAIDGYGRELILPTPLEITGEELKGFADEWGKNVTIFDVWLIYNEVTYTPPQRGRVENCNDTRISEQTCLRFTEGVDKKVTTADRRKPDVVPEENMDFQPWQTPPDDWMNPWPVYLGQFIKNADGILVDINNRPYAELIGECITTPSGQGWMELKDDGGIVRRFSINLLDDKAVMTKRLDLQYSESTRETQATIWGNLVINDHMGRDADRKPQILKSNLSVGGQPKQDPRFPVYARGLHFDTPRVTPEKAAPWQLYRTQFKPKDAPPETKPIDQLRLEIFNPGDDGDQTAYGFSIGHWGIDKSKPGSQSEYQSCLRLISDCTVELKKELRVDISRIQQAPIPADPNDIRFTKVMIETWLKGIVLATKRLADYYNAIAQGSSDLKLIFNSDLPDSLITNTTVNYTANLQNAGTEDLKSLKVSQLVVIAPDLNPDATLVHTDSDTLAAGQSVTLKSSLHVPQQPGQILVIITASALNSSGQAINSIAMKLINTGSLQ